MPQDQRSSVSRNHSTPEVPRPTLAIWQSLESERIRWEGQVQIVGQEGDLPALLVITGKRLALIANNEIALDFPLGWMRPAPKLMAENGVRLYISPNGESQIAQPMLLRAKAGRAAAAEIAAVLTGRTFASRSATSPMHIPEWKDRVGASASVALPQLKDEATSRTSRPKAAWPPLETSGVSSHSTPKAASRPKPSANIAPWRVGSDVPEPRPVPANTSRAARLLGTSEDGFTVTDQTRKAGDIPVQPASERKHKMPMWLLNLAVVAMVLAGFGYVAVDRGYDADDLKALVPGNVAGYLGIDKPTNNGEVALAPEDAGTKDTPIQQGGDNRLLPVKDTTVEPTNEPEPEVTVEAAAVDAGEDGMDSIGGSSGQLPVSESVFDTANGTVEAPIETEETIEEPVVTEEVAEEDPIETEVVVEEEPVETEEAVATEEVRDPVDPTIDPTAVDETPVTPEPTVAPTQTVTIEQPASVADGTVPNQEFQQGGIRYSIDAINTGAAIDALPEINVIDGTWVVITLTGANTGSADQLFDMNGFVLMADGNAIPLDLGTAWVNGLLGNDPAYGNADTSTWAPGEQHRFTLVYRAPANVTNLSLVAGDQQIALDAAITNSVGLREVATDQAPAATVTGTVTEVIDGQTIVVDVDGELITVRYLGMDAPTGEACFASESTLINAELVEGAEVTMERQSVDTNARGVWVRDVWVTDNSGNQVLVSQALVSQGAATSKVSEPNSRYAGWLGSTEQEAETNGTGLWSLCSIND